MTVAEKIAGCANSLISQNARRWYVSLIVAYVAFLACNLVLDYWLQPLFEFRLGSPGATLGADEFKEILARAGGLSQIDPNARAAGKSEAEFLYARVGLVVTFDDLEAPKICHIKWYPNSVTKQKTFKQASEIKAPDPAAVNLIMTADNETNVTYRFMYDDIETESREIIERQGGWLLAVRPVNVLTELNEVAADLIVNIKSFNSTQKWRNDILQAGNKDGYSPPSDEEARQISRAVEGILAVVFSRYDSTRTVNPARPLPILRNATLAARMLNGSNILGWIQLVIAVVFLRGLIAAFYRANALEGRLAEKCIDSLPALGFLGTLLGMTIAFSSGLENRINLTQSLTLAISTSALALVGALLILWSKRL